VVKFRSLLFFKYCLIKAKSVLSSTVRLHCELAFDLVTPQLDTFILVPKCTGADNLVQMLQYFPRHCVNNVVQDAQTDRQTHGLTNGLNA